MNQYIASLKTGQPISAWPGALDTSIPLAPLAPGAWLGNYQLEEHLGEGGFGQVYRARDQRGAPVAIKIIANTEVGYREAQILQASVHPGIPQLKDMFLSPYGFAIVQEFALGETMLSRQIRVGGCLPVDEVLATGWQVAVILASLHKQAPPVLHLDVKPENLLLRTDGRVMLLDFGVAILAGVGWSVTGGTPAYMPPEQLVRRADPRSDVYALGGTLWDLLTGQPPEPLDARFPPLPEACPRRVQQLLRHMLQLRPEQRPSSAKVAEQLRALASASVKGRRR